MQRIRFELREHAEQAEPAISGWGLLTSGDNGLSVLTMDHEYPDRKPAPGWLLSASGRAWNVVAAEGKYLTVREAF